MVHRRAINPCMRKSIILTPTTIHFPIPTPAYQIPFPHSPISAPAKTKAVFRPSDEIISSVDQAALQMDGLAASCCAGRFAPFPSAFTWSGRRRPTFLALAASSPSPDESKLDKGELMELKFGRMIGEDPNLTLAKIMGRRANPDVSYLDIEKEFKKKKGKSKFELVEIPLDWGKKEVEPSNSMDDLRVRSKSLKADKGLNLVRPVLKKGIGSEEKAGNASVIAGREHSQSSRKINTKSAGAVNVTLRKPTVLQADDIEMEKLEIKPNLSLKMRKNLLNKTKDSGGNFSNITLLKKPEPVGISSNCNQVNMSSVDAVGSNSVKASMESSNVTLSKKPEPIGISLNSNQEDMSSADAVGLSSGNEGVESSNVAMLKKPEPIRISLNSNQENIASADAVGLSSGRASMESSNVTLSKTPEPTGIFLNNDEENMSSADAIGSNSGMVSMESGGEEISELRTMLLGQDEQKDEIRASQLTIGLQRPVLSDSGSTDMGSTITQAVDLNSVHSSSNSFRQAALQGKPLRLEPPEIQRPDPSGAEKMDVSDGIHNDAEEITHFQSAGLGEHEEKDWAMAEDFLQTEKRVEVEVISSSSKGFVVSFGSLVGFLPYRNLGARWKFLAFESWLRKKGLDPSLYRQNLGILGNYKMQNRNLVLDSDQNLEAVQQLGDKPAADTKFGDLLDAYDQEKTKFLSSFVGQRINACVILADRNSRKLLFSARPKEKEDITEKKRSLMAKLSIGDVVKCRIKKIKYFGIFVEVEGVPALIHQTEVSWDATLDPSTYFKIGQIIEAKVHQLDFALERITLSLKEITPDPIVEALESLESVLSDYNALDGSRGAEQADVEWPDVESLIQELKKIEGVDCVSKGRFFLSPGLAPTFQVYMASVLDNQYKLLARSGNKVQEVIVQASLDKEEMKAAILTCTNRVK